MGRELGSQFKKKCLIPQGNHLTPPPLLGENIIMCITSMYLVHSYTKLFREWAVLRVCGISWVSPLSIFFVIFVVVSLVRTACEK